MTQFSPQQKVFAVAACVGALFMCLLALGLACFVWMLFQEVADGKPITEDFETSRSFAGLVWPIAPFLVAWCCVAVALFLLGLRQLRDGSRDAISDSWVSRVLGEGRTRWLLCLHLPFAVCPLLVMAWFCALGLPDYLFDQEFMIPDFTGLFFDSLHEGKWTTLAAAFSLVVAADIFLLWFLKRSGWYGLRGVWSIAMILASVSMTLFVYLSLFWVPRWEFEGNMGVALPSAEEAAESLEAVVDESAPANERASALGRLRMVEFGANFGWLDKAMITQVRDVCNEILQRAEENSDVRIAAFHARFVLAEYQDNDERCRTVLRFIDQDKSENWILELLRDPMRNVTDSSLRKRGYAKLVQTLQELKFDDLNPPMDEHVKWEFIYLSSHENPGVANAAKEALDRIRPVP